MNDAQGQLIRWPRCYDCLVQLITLGREEKLRQRILDLADIENQKISPFWLDFEKEDEPRKNIALLESARNILIPWRSAAAQVVECRHDTNSGAVKKNRSRIRL